MTAPVQTTSPIPPQVIVDMKRKLKCSVLSPLTATRPYPNDATQRTYVQNAYQSINVTGIGKMPLQVRVAQVDPVPSEILLPPGAFERKTAKDPTFSRYQNAPLEERAKVWLESARNIAERDALPGYCNVFSMITVAILVADDSPLPIDTRVEWIGSGSGARGHMAVVVNREPQSTPSDPDTWGANYLIVDYWYALQAGVDPVFLQRTKAAIDAKRNNGTPLDDHDRFRLFFDDQGTAKVFGEFRVGAYKPFKIKEKSPGRV